jgi:hypothetical protein
MAKNDFLSWDLVANNNTDVGNINIAEGCPPSNINNAIREVMAQLRAGVDAGTAFAAKSGNYTALAADNNAFHRYSATATIALTAAATLGADWHYSAMADGGDLVIDPNASELINGATTLRVPDGSLVYVICTGTAFYAVIISTTAYGDCRLTLSGANLLLSRCNGRRLTINGVGEVIPAAGITLAATALTPSTLYYIYAYMNSGTMTLEASATVPAADTATGIQIKTGDATRTLVGMARPITGPAWADSAKQRFVLSYYNRVKKHGEGNFTATRSTTSGTFVEINTEIRVEFLAWGDTELWFSTGGAMATSPGGGLQSTRITLDGTVNWFAQASQQTLQDYVIPLSISGPIQPTIGYHYATLLGGVTSGTAIWLGTGGSTCFIFASIEG